jgi:hypothetical protein
MKMKLINRIQLLAVLACIAILCSANESFGQRDVRVDQSDRLLIMKNGSILRGQIKTISTGHLLATKTGRVLITFNQAHFVADNLNDAYLRLRLEVRNPNVAVHRDLADWCMRHKLFRQAEREMRDALRIDPENETVRLMLDRLQQEIARQDPNKKPVVKQVTFSNVAKRPEARSLSGLTQPTAKYFVSDIQPLVTSHCASARCHGPAAKTEFKLTRVHLSSGTHRIATERNLASMLKFMDLDRPNDSKLIRVATSSHAGKAMFRGRAGHAQIQKLRAWINTVADELNPDRKTKEQIDRTNSRLYQRDALLSDATPTASVFSSSRSTNRLPIDPLSMPAETGTAARSRIRARSSQLTRSREERPFNVPARDQQPPPEEATQPGILRSNFQKLLEEKRPDAFDPNEFNRRYAGRNRSIR